MWLLAVVVVVVAVVVVVVSVVIVVVVVVVVFLVGVVIPIKSSRSGSKPRVFNTFDLEHNGVHFFDIE